MNMNTNTGSIEDDPRIFLVPHTHYDAIWVFNKEDYYYINIELILKQALDLIKKTDYKFLIEQTFLLEHIEVIIHNCLQKLESMQRKKR